MKSDRYYDILGVGRLPSVTTILSVISKPALYHWHAKHGSTKALTVMGRLKAKSEDLYQAIHKELGVDFFRDGTSLAEEAADYGKQAHSIIEADLNGDHLGDLDLLDRPPPVREAIHSFRAWRDRTQFRVMKTESLIYSKKLGYAGTCDAIGETKDGVTLLDWKTSSGIWPEFHLQAIAYKYAAEEMTGERIPNAMICRFGKDGSFEDYTIPPMDHPDLFDRFIDAKHLWEWQKKGRRK